MTETERNQLLVRYFGATRRQVDAMRDMHDYGKARTAALRELLAGGLSQLEISNLVGLSPANVHRLLHRGDSR